MAKQTDGKASDAKQKSSGESKQKGSRRSEAAAGVDTRPAEGRPKSASGNARLRERYRKSVIASMQQDFGYKNAMAIPRVEKVSINIGLGEATGNSKLMDSAVNELSAIAGQKPVVTKAKKSIAAFKLREGMPIGCMVTLRGDRMYEFLDRLMNVALPRVRDFRGVSPKSFDGRGNYTLGLKDQLIFPEIDYNKVDKTKGMNISIITTAKTDAEGVALLRHMGMPFRQ